MIVELIFLCFVIYILLYFFGVFQVQPEIQRFINNKNNQSAVESQLRSENMNSVHSVHSVHSVKSLDRQFAQLNISPESTDPSEYTPRVLFKSHSEKRVIAPDGTIRDSKVKTK